MIPIKNMIKTKEITLCKNRIIVFYKPENKNIKGYLVVEYNKKNKITNLHLEEDLTGYTEDFCKERIKYPFNSQLDINIMSILERYKIKKI